MTSRFSLTIPLTLGLCSVVAAEPVSSKANSPPRLDQLGDPLPAGALARLGTTRFRHGSYVSQVAWSPDGKLNFSLSGDGAGVRVWDAASGRLLNRIGDAVVSSFAVSPDGKSICTGEDFGAIRLWNLQTGKEELPRISPGATTPDERVQRENEVIKPLVFSPDGRFVCALRTQAHSIEIWDVAARRLVAEIRSDGDALFSTFCLSRDGQLVLAGTHNGTIRTFRTANGQAVATWRGHSELVTAIASCADGRAVSIAADKRIIGWDQASGRASFQTIVSDFPAAVAVSPDGRNVAFTAADPESESQSLEIRSTADGKILRTLRGVAAPSITLAFSPGGKWLAAGANSSITIVSPTTGEYAQPSSGHPAALTTVVMTADGARAATCSMHDRNAILWDTKTGREIRRFGDHSIGVDEVQFSPDGKLLATGCRGNPVFLWNTTTGRLLHRLDEHPSVGPYFRFSPDGKTIATANEKGPIGVWDCDSGRRLWEYAGPPHGVASLLAFSDGKLLVLERPDDDDEQELTPVQVWDAIAGRMMRRFAGHKGAVYSAVLSADGRMLASRGEDKFIRVWEMATGEERRAFSDPDEPKGWIGTQLLAFSPDGRMLASCGTAKHNVRLWDIVGNRELPPIEGHVGNVIALDFPGDGKRLLTGSEDSTALIWDTSDRLPASSTKPLSPAELAQLWAELAHVNGAASFDVLTRLANGGDPAVAFLRERLGGARVAGHEQIAKWIAELDHPQFAIRERATQSLAQIAGQANAQLKKAESTATAEARRRIRKILESQFDPGQSGDRLRERRAIESLELNASARAREFLRDLSAGPEGAFLTVESRESLRRLERR